ncbi:MAG: rod shape-determining protein RodA [bacterium]
MKPRGIFPRDFDRVLFFSLLGLLAIGIVMVYSAGQTSAGAMPRLHLKQISWAIIGLGGLAAALAIPYKSFDALAYPAYVLGILLLLFVLAAQGTPLVRERWILLGPLQFQPSEVAKFSVIFVLARYFSGVKTRRSSFITLAIPTVLTFVPLILILKEPDLGTSLTLAGVLLPVLYWSGVPVLTLFFMVSPLFAVLASLHLLPFVLYLIALTALLVYGRERNLTVLAIVLIINLGAGIARPILWNQLKPYQKGRILSFVNPHDTLGSAYQIIQSKVAIGSGGVAGKGFMEGTQKGLSFLPEQHTDFIYSVVGEELGLLGCATILVLFGVLISRAVGIAAHTKNRFGSILVLGITALIAFQVVVNIGMTLGMLPVTGIPLPLISYGGTSLATTLFGIGLILNVGMHRRDY